MNKDILALMKRAVQALNMAPNFKLNDRANSTSYELAALVSIAVRDEEEAGYIWTDDEVFKLNAGQHDDRFHGYTCGKDSRHRKLIATRKGWRCADCDYKQGWAHGLGKSVEPAAVDDDEKATIPELLVGEFGIYRDEPDGRVLSIGHWEPDKIHGKPMTEFHAKLQIVVGDVRRMVDPEYKKGMVFDVIDPSL